MAIALGAAHAVAVTEDGGVFVYGAGAHGQLGTGALVPRELRPTLLCERLGGTRVANVAAGFRHSVAITEDGGCWTWGFGANGRLGHGNEERGLVPKKIPPKQLQGAKAVMAACSSLLAGHTALVTDDGNLWTWGRGSEGQLGHHDLQTKLVPTLIARDLFAGAAISMVACGGSHTTCVTNFGALWSWGANDWGQLGHGDVERRELPALVRGTGEGGIRILVVSCGDRNTAAVTSSGSLWVWGAGDAGRLGLGDELYRLVPTEIGSDRFSGKKVVLVDCGFSHTGAITVDGELWMWGSDVNGQLGIGRIEGCPDRLVPTRVCVDGMENDRFATVSCGVQSTTAVTENGLVWAWGSADQGVLGLGCERVTMQPTHVGGFGARIGRCRQLPTCCATAFAMSQHHRLGQNSKASVLVGDLVQRILEAAHSWPQGPADQASGVLRLMGGGLTVPPRTLESVCHGTNPTADISMEGSRSMQQESETLAAAGEEGIADAGGEEQMISREAVADVWVEQPSMELEAHDDHFVLPGHELQSQPPVSPNTTQLHPTQIPASGLNSQAPATSEGSAEPSAVPEHTSSAPTSSATPSRKEHHLILPARVRLAGGTRPRPVFSGTTLLLAESSDGSSLVTSDAPTESSVTSAVTSAPVGDREASVGMNAASSSLPPAAGGPAITPSFRGPKQTPSHPPPRQLESAGPEIELCGDEYLYACAQEHGNTGQATTNTSLKLPSPHAHRQLQEAPGPGEKAAVQLLPAEKNFSGSGGDVGAKRDENSVANRMPGEAIGSDVGAEGEIVTSEMIARLESFYLRHDPSLISDARRILARYQSLEQLQGDLQCRYGDDLGKAMVAPLMKVRTEHSGAQPSSERYSLTTSSLHEPIMFGSTGPGRGAAEDLEVPCQQFARRRQSGEKSIIGSSPNLAGHDFTVEHAIQAAAGAEDRPAGGKGPGSRDGLAEACQARTNFGGGVSYVDSVVAPVLPSMLQQTRVISTIRGYQLGGAPQTPELSREERRCKLAAAADKRALQAAADQSSPAASHQRGRSLWT